MNLTDIQVIKKSGEREPFDYDKVHKLITFASEGLKGVSHSEIALGISKRLDGVKEITSSKITELLIQSSNDLIGEHSSNYQYVSGRMTSYDIRKQVYGSFDVPDLYQIIVKNINDGWYDPEILQMYSKEEIDFFDSQINHAKDDHFTIAAWLQFKDKYLVRDKKLPKGEGYKETPQIAYMLVAMILMKKYNDKNLVVRYYNAISSASNSTISLPTPITAGVRTPTKQFSSCVKVKIGDSLDSINSGSACVVNYTAKRAGIGCDMGELRPLGSPIRNGEAFHTGITAFVKLIQSASGSASQGGVRPGASTIFYPVFHKEIEDIIVFKNNRGNEENRVRHVDHGIALNLHFYKKAINDEDYFLFDQSQAPGLYEAFYGDPEEFERLYDKYSKDSTVSKKKVSAMELIQNIAIERAQTGRLYIINIDNVNNQGLFKRTVYQSNLCLEITLPTADLTRMSNFYMEEAIRYGVYRGDESPDEFQEKFGEVALCTLSNINMGMIKKPSDLEEPCKLAVYALDALLDYQDYPLIAAEVPSKKRRTLGIGVNNLAYWFAKNKIKYGENLEVLDEYMEAMYYYLLKASVELAKEYGACEWMDDIEATTFTFEKRSKGIDEFVPHQTRQDWESLREEIKKYGVRNSTLMSTPPSESNSVVINATNGIEPIKSKAIVKKNGDSSYTQVFPNTSLPYEIVWNVTNDAYLLVVGVMQKYHDQALSANTNYDPEKFPGGSVPLGVLLKHMILAQKIGIKTLYYQNTPGLEDSSDCASCKL